MPGQPTIHPVNCPCCGFLLDNRPLRKKKCPSCGNFIYPRIRPSDRTQILVDEKGATIIDNEWASIHLIQKMQNYGLSIDIYEEIKAKLFKEFQSEPSNNDIAFTFLNEKLLACMKKADWKEMSVIYFEQALILHSENRDCFRLMQ
jgi:hypothetical protein